MTSSAAKPTRSARKAKGHGHLRRAEILQAAEGIFLREGYQGATIRKIAEEVGVSSTALYMHFTDKDEMLLEIADNAVSPLHEICLEIAKRPLEPDARLRLMLEAYMRFGLENPNAYRLVYGSGFGPLPPARQERVNQISSRCYGLFVDAAAEMAEAGRLQVESAKLAVHVLWSSCHGAVMLRLGRTDLDWEADQMLTAAVLDSVLCGLLKA